MPAQDSKGGAGLRADSSPPKATLKYKKYSNNDDPLAGTKKPPSQHIVEQKQPTTHVDGWRPRPKIIEFLNIADYSHQTECSVPIDEPIFQPFPPEVTFHGYEPFVTYETMLYFRNNDVVPRRLKVLAPDTPHFQVRKVAGPSKDADGSKVAAGMELVYAITFRPESLEDYSCDLVVCTEREKFIVPIIAVGAAAALDFPDLVEFAPAACKTTAKQVVFLRNVGNKAASFRFSTYEPFGISPAHGMLGPGETLQCAVTFTPPACNRYEGELELQYDTGKCVYAQLVGYGKEEDVGLSQGVITLLPTYVTKMSQKTFRIVNNSDVELAYSIKANPSAQEEQLGVSRRLADLHASVQMTHHASIDGAGRGASLAGEGSGEGSARGSPSPDAESEDEDQILASSTLTITRDYKAKRRAMLLDQQLFGDANFQVHPAEGVVHPHSELEVVVQFFPDYARDYEVVGHIDVQGRADRLPIVFKAKGLGPAAVFSYDVLDVGDTFVNTLHQYEVELQNRGKIDVEYQLMPAETMFANKFSFEPDRGHLTGGQIQVIKVKLLSDLLGAFDEVFKWSIKGSSVPLTLQFKGRCCAPSFEVDCDQLDYGVVSYGFRYTKEVMLTNTSEIPMRFSWRVPQDAGQTKEFQILPQKGSILPHGKQKISVEFVSHTVQKYAMELVMDIPMVADRQLVLPIKAECAVPKLALAEPVLQFGECFIRHPYKQTMVLVNESKLPAKFEIQPQESASSGLATFTAEPVSGGIAAKGEQAVEITVSTNTLGRIQLPVRIKVIGSRGPPMQCIVDAKSIGPHLLFGADPEARSPEARISFDKVQVLQDHTYDLHLHNPCLIPANFKMFVEGKDSSFTVEPREARLEPGDSMIAKVGVFLDETSTFRDVLHVLVSEGADVPIPLDATGTGNTVVSEEMSDVLDFSHQFVGRAFSRDIMVHNMGRKTVSLVWQNLQADEVKKEFSKMTRGTGKKFEMSMVPPESQPVFTITPDKLVLNSKESCVFTISGIAHRAGEIAEQLICTASTAANSKGGKRVFDTSLRADVATPLLDFSERCLAFLHQYVKGAPIELLTKPLTVRNISKLPLTFTLKAPAPFLVDRPNWHLDVDEAATLNVQVDPLFKGDLNSAVIKNKLQVVYADNPQKDSIDLVATLDFPNLSFETASVEFGTVLLDTNKRIPVKVTNNSAVEVVYSWAWDQSSSTKQDAETASMLSMATSKSAMKGAKPPPTQLFDILPIKGVLKPGESEDITFSFFAFPGVRASATAMCHVEGGPAYTVQMSAESNNIKYNVEPQFFDLGMQLYDRTTERELTVTNTGKVPFDYKINMGALSRPGIVEAVPASGKIAAGGKELIKLKVCPGVPDRLVEAVLVEVAHFDPVQVQVVVEGVFPGVTLGLPRLKDELFASCLTQAQNVAMAAAQRAAERAKQAITSGSRSPSRSPSRSLSMSPSRRVRTAKSESETGQPPSGATTRPQSSASVKPPATGKSRAEEGPASEKKLEQEAERMRLVQLLLEREAARNAPTPEADVQGGRDTQKKPPKQEPPKLVVDPVTGKKVKVPIQPPIPAIYSAHYVLDFGYVVKGTSKTRKFKMTNTSNQAVTFRFDKGVLETWGIKVEPEAVSKLPGAPDCGSIEVAVTLQAAKPQVMQGPMELVLPLAIKGGPPVLLTMKAHVQMPDLKLSQDTLDFDRVQTGWSKVITVQLHNYKQVPCEWTVKKPVEASKAKDWSYFRVEPSEGMLEPDQKLNVRFIFTPVLNRESLYSQAIPIKVNLNAAGKVVNCSGRGETPKIVFQPAFVDCGPILPKFDGQAPNEAEFELLNPCPFPVEVVSLDFDKQYLVDEDTLRVIDRYGESGQLCMTPLQPGEKLWQELVDEAEHKKAMEAAAAEATAKAAAEAEAAAAAAVAAGGAPAPAPDAAATPAADEVGEVEAVSRPEVVIPQKTIVVVVGPKNSDASAQARLVADRYSVPLTTLDDLLLEAADREPPPEPEPDPNAPAPEPTPVPAAPPAPPAAPGARPASSTAKGAAAAPPPPPPVDPAVPPPADMPPPFDREISDLLFDKVLIDPDLEGQPGFVPLHTKLAPQELQDLVVRALKHALAQEHFAKGLVLDGLQSKYLEPHLVALCLIKALGLEPVMPPPTPDELKKKAPAPKKGEAPPPPKAPDMWMGNQTIHVLEVTPERDLMTSRMRKLRDEAEAAAKAAAEAEAAAAAAAAAAEAEAAAANGEAPAQQRAGTPEPSSTPPPEPAPEPTPEEKEAARLAAEEAARQEAEAKEAMLQADVSALLDGWQQQVTKLLAEAVGRPAPENKVTYRRVGYTTELPQEKLLLDTVGISFKLGAISNILPGLDTDSTIIPDPYIMQCMAKPKPRPARNPILKFKLFTLVKPEDLPPPPEDPITPKGGKPKTPPKGAQKGKGAPEPPPVPTRPMTDQTRWVIPPNGNVKLLVQFQSEDVGKCTETFAFEVVRGEKLNTVLVTGTCDHPHISADYRNVFYKKVKARPQTPTLARQFVINKNMFEFGPLLVGKDATGYQDGAHPDNTAKFRITNNGLFDLHVDFVLKSKDDPGDGKDKKAKKPSSASKGKDKKAGGLQLDGVFTLNPPSMDLKIDETQELTVYAFPTDEGPLEDIILCKIKDNPVPVEFPISVIGGKPKVAVKLDDGASNAWDAPLPNPNKLLVDGVLFQRLLVNKKDTQNFVIINPGLLPIKWRLAGVDKLPREFSMYPTSGELAARCDVKVTVEFNAVEKREVTHQVNLEVLDKAELQGVATSIPIKMKGEAYKIELDIKFPQEGLNGVDFGTVRVVDDVMKNIVIKNLGKYKISFNFACKSALVKELFTMVPESGDIEPGKEQAVQVWFNKEHALKREVTLVGNSDMTLSIIEPLTTNKEELIPIKISARAVFSKYAVTPARGINFGPQTYNTTSKPKTFEITNLGEFPFNYKLFNYAQPPPPTPETGEKKDKKAAAPAKGKPGTPGGLTLDKFNFDPCEGTVQPGARQEIAVTFRSEGSRVYSEVLGINISERDFNDAPGGIPYEVVGESCIPGVDAQNMEAIFEEHMISATLDPFNPRNNEFGLRERVFNFGAVIATLPDGPPADPKAEKRAPSPSGRGASGGRVSTPGGAPGGAASAAASGAGVKANLKFINPVKVPCVVNFSIKPRGDAAAGGKGGGKGGKDAGAADANYPMEVVPNQLVIPPHEYRYVTVYFAPRAIQAYNATLEAVVENGSDPKTKGFTCELRGEGTLPSLSLQEPMVFDKDGRPLLKFPRLLLGRSAQARITVRNNGILHANARIEMDHHPCFTLEEGSQAFSVESKMGKSFTVTFRPLEAKTWQGEVRLRVQNNPFEDYRIALTGDGYQEDVTFDALPNDALDELRLPDGPLGKPRLIAFSLRNHNQQKHFRFKWPVVNYLTFSPAMGHLHAGATKDVTVTFKADAPVKLNPQDVKLALAQINYTAGTPVEWDDRSVVADYSAAAPAAGAPAGTAAAPAQPQSRPEPEPAVTEVAGTNKELLLKVFAVADNPKFECDLKPIAFKPTMMFQTRSFTFPLANTSSSKMDYRFNVYLPGGQLDTSGLYSVSPEGGVVEPGQSASITVRFSPQEVEDCTRLLRCEIPNLDPNAPPFERQLAGRVLRPWCHFELPESDYITSGRRNPEMPGPSGNIEPLDPTTKVLEFESLGVRVKNTKRFFVLNPTGIQYEFTWDPVGPNSRGPPFTCNTRHGIISGGRRFEMVFEYTPMADTPAESFWVFRIPEQNIEVPFLLAGLVAEPRVYFDRPALNFGQVLVGAQLKQSLTLVNSEDLPFHFNLDKNSYDATDDVIRSTGQRPVVEFTPSSGVVPPHSSMDIVATFTPRLEKLYNYNVVCRVRNKPTHLQLNVKGDGFAIHETLQIDSADGIITLAPKMPNTVDYGQVVINERAVKAISMINSGGTPFDYVWDVGTNPRISIKPEGGTVGKGERVACELSYHPHGPDKLSDYKVTCNIVNGNKYTLLLRGTGHKPKLELSFYAHDFGQVNLFQAGMAPAVKLLRMKNNDTQAINVDPQWANTEEWQIDCTPVTLQPGESRDVSITFKPSQPQPYATALPLEINGLFTVNVDLKGEGTPMRVEVANPAQRTVNFGSVNRNQSTTRVVQVINRGKVAVSVRMTPSAEALARYNIDVLPAAELLLRPRETADMTFFYRPQSRMRPFTQDFIVDVMGVQVPLLTLTGACLGTELKLASDSLPFGPVVLGSRAVKRLQLENTGDVGTKFVWDKAALGDNFSIFPAEGFLAPHQDVKLDVTFHPTAVNPDVRVERLRVRVEGGEDRFLTLTGACVATSGNPETVNFACNVRASTTQNINLSNPSSSAWQLRPVVQNDFFTGAEFVNVPANSKATYTVTYKPLTMSTAEQPHEGSVFFPIPDGSGLLYRLIGRAESPVPEGKVEATVEAKKGHVEVFKVSNWLHKPQRFKVIIDRKQCDKATEASGGEYVDVPALSSKDYKLNFMSYTAGTSLLTVTFKNEASGEYIFYEAKFTATPPGPRGTLALEAPVRTQTSGRVSVRNPLMQDVAIKASSSNKQVSVAPSITLPANSITDVEVKYRPLLVGAADATLKLESAELGLFEWNLKLSGAPTNPERSMAFSVPLGSRETQVFRFTHWLDEKADYKCSFKSGAGGAFEVLPAVSAPPAAGASGIEVTVEVAFEPSAIGESIRDTLVISSPTAGEYQCPLVGRCIPPKPQGPIDCSKGSGAVPFKNVFNAEAEFLYSVDNAAFQVKPSEKIGSKKVTNIGVSFKPADASKPRTGKLTVSCPSQTTSTWVFYLQA